MDKLNKYIVQVSELLCHRVDVEASSREEAIDKIKDDYCNSKLVLTADNYVDGSVQFDIIKETNDIDMPIANY